MTGRDQDARTADEADEAFQIWEAQVSAAMLPASTDPIPGFRFFGTIGAVVSIPDLTIVNSASAGHVVRRTARHIARSNTEMVSAVITTAGTKPIYTDGVTTLMVPGSMVLVDSTITMSIRIEDPTSSVVVNVARETLFERSGLRRDAFHTLLRTPVAVGPEGLAVSEYFRSLSAMSAQFSTEAATFASYGIDLLAAVLALRAQTSPLSPSVTAHARERVRSFLNANFADPMLTATKVARAVNLSRSTLYRITESDGGVSTILRKIRIAHARRILATHPFATVVDIATACGFTSDRQFYRVFRAETGSTPGEYRAAHHHPPTP
ncbi:AraC family transcriptional regulator [Nocardia tengchongensis]|uniref:AraC family transcriptional regulator n=1 Tax=Nocardia tengchongensis TaxID=2055889 RepID=UPI0036B0FA4C